MGAFTPGTARIREGVLYTGFIEYKEDDEPSYLRSGSLHAIAASNGAKQWSTNAVVHDIAVPDGDYLYLSSSVASSEPPDRWQRLTKVRKDTGETIEFLYEERSSDTFNGLLVVGGTLVAKQRDTLLAFSLSNNERLWSHGDVDGYAIHNGTVYLVSDGLIACDLDTGDQLWSSSTATDGPRDPDFGQPRIQDEFILIRDRDDNTVYVYDTDGTVVRDYRITDTLGGPQSSP
ncbi:PQQ-binding-like beta-propeller repeat protein [Halobaculum rubrum]|uniref:outer membrane protein assembly factor BamB family protein n=1 Tax=Halobaculum rubrum TaxID=2872158 RepID=UPI001CA44669|nr:PQQ-binding-like beta-propeller repeat protein [Halobaculum rubrum]QZX99223.1 PQQ-binding-like beta-propeller repeat protein [Halobaculum rubrum]